MRFPFVIVPAAFLLLVSTAAWAAPCGEGEEPKEDCKEYEAYMAPGATFQAIAPMKGGPYFGGGFQLAVAQWAHDNDDYGPARGSVFFQTSMLRSPASEHTMLVVEGGLTLAFERNAHRRYLIPYFGFTSGGLFQEGAPDTGFVQPALGLHVFWHPNIVVDVSGGYLFPFERVDDLMGFRGQASVRLHMW